MTKRMWSWAFLLCGAIVFFLGADEPAILVVLMAIYFLILEIADR